METLQSIVSHPWFTPLVMTALIILVFPLLAGYIVLVERKVLADMQVRLGPMRVGPHGLLQPIADALKLLLEVGALRLDADAIGKHGTGYLELNWEDDREALLRAIQHTLFFKKLRGDLVVTLYNQKEVWTKLGYEGSSFEHGGYLDRGFNDIDWLPTT